MKVTRTKKNSISVDILHNIKNKHKHIMYWFVENNAKT